MKLTLKDVYNQRKGILNFTANLYNSTSHSEYTPAQDSFDQLMRYYKVTPDVPKNVQPKWDPNDNSKDKEIIAQYNKQVKSYGHQMAMQKNEYLKAFQKMILSGRAEVAAHRVALDAYVLMEEKYKDLVDANQDNLEDPVIVESKKNLDIFKAQLLKNDIYEFEIEAAKKGDPDLDEKIIKGVFKSLQDRNLALQERYKVTGFVAAPKEFTAAAKTILSGENLKKFAAGNVDETNNEFYGILKNAGYNYARNIPVDYFVCPTDIQKAYPGYKFNENNEMVRKENTGFFNAIANFFHRLANGGKVETYNAALRQAKEGLDDKAALEEAEKMNQYAEAVKAEKTRVLANEDFLKEHEEDSKAVLDFEAERKAELKLEITKEAEADNAKAEAFKANPDENPFVGPGLDQID